MLWLGPFMIEAIVGPDTFYLKQLDGEMIEHILSYAIGWRNYRIASQWEISQSLLLSKHYVSLD
jgi:hypothetical protein